MAPPTIVCVHLPALLGCEEAGQGQRNKRRRHAVGRQTLGTRNGNIRREEKPIALDLGEILRIWGFFKVLGVAVDLVEHVWAQACERHPRGAVRVKDWGGLETGQIAGAGECARGQDIR